MDINRPITNTKLLNAMEDLGKDNNKEQIFINELFKAKFLCPARVELKNSTKGDRGQITVGEESTISLTSIDDKHGKHFLMAFTDWEEIKKWNKEANIQTIILTCKDYQQILIKDDSLYAGFVINPHSANIILNKEILENIYSDEKVMQAGESVMIGEPKDYPKDMAEKLKETFMDIADIRSAYLLWMARNSETSYLLVLDANGNEQKLFPVVAEICQSYLKGKIIDMVPFSSQFGQSAVKNQTPFYTSSKEG